MHKNEDKHNEDKYFKRLEFEHELINRRLTWLLSSQTILFAAYGIYCYGMRNVDPSFTVNAEYNWLGDPTGPYHHINNLGGLGDTVSDYVDFDPLLTGPVGVYEYKPTPNP